MATTVDQVLSTARIRINHPLPNGNFLSHLVEFKNRKARCGDWNYTMHVDPELYIWGFNSFNLDEVKILPWHPDFNDVSTFAKIS